MADPEVQWSYKKTLGDIQTLAILANDPHASLPSSFTICSTVMDVLSKKPNEQMFFNLLGNDGKQLLSAMMFDVRLYATKVVSGKIPPVFPYQWVRSCMAINVTSTMIQWVVDGRLVENSTIDVLKNSSNMPTDLSGKIFLGAWQYPTESWLVFSNKFTNLNIFSSVLPLAAMEKRTKGGACFEEGDYLAWPDIRWDLRGQATIESVKAEEPNIDPTINLYNAPFVGLRSCKHFCKNLGTRMPSVSTQETSVSLQMFCEKNLEKEQYPIWLAINDTDQEGVWRDIYTGRSLNFTLPWIGNEPNGGNRENCAVLGNCLWIDVPCEGSRPCMCQAQPRPYLKLLGLCKETAIDFNFQPQNDKANFKKLKLMGHSTTIEYDDTTKNWIMKIVDSNVTGKSRSSHASFTLGRHTWTIFGDTGCNEKGSSYTKELKMSGCQDSDFTCYNGQCVSMEHNCDQVPHCRDKSDEMDCEILYLERGYNKNVPPIMFTNGNQASVSVSVKLFKVVDINEEDYSIELQFEISLVWKENRATYHNLKHDKTLNALTQAEIGKLWLPEVIYENTDQKETTRLGDIWEWKTRVVVQREGNGTKSGPDVVDESYIFEGAENSLIMQQTYSHIFQCFYDLTLYPFDTQVCFDFIHIMIDFRFVQSKWMYQV